jgi:hypothetical protein
MVFEISLARGLLVTLSLLAFWNISMYRALGSVQKLRALVHRPLPLLASSLRVLDGLIDIWPRVALILEASRNGFTRLPLSITLLCRLKLWRNIHSFSEVDIVGINLKSALRHHESSLLLGMLRHSRALPISSFVNELSSVLLLQRAFLNAEDHLVSIAARPLTNSLWIFPLFILGLNWVLTEHSSSICSGWAIVHIGWSLELLARVYSSLMEHGCIELTVRCLIHSDSEVLD